MGALPEQFDPTKPFELLADKVPDSRGRSLAERVAAKLGREDQLITDFGASISVPPSIDAPHPSAVSKCRVGKDGAIGS